MAEKPPNTFAGPTTTPTDVKTSPTLSQGSSHDTLISASENAAETTYPEGGLQAWLVVFGSFCGMLSSFGLINTTGTLVAYLSTNQLRDYSSSTIAWIFSIYLFLVFFTGVQAGPWFDAKGPGWPVGIGTILFIGGTFGLANSTEYWHFILSISIAAGIGTGLIFTPIISAVAHFFARKRGTATGIAAAGGAAGGVIYPLILPELFKTVEYTWSIRILGFIFIFLISITNLLVRKRLPAKENVTIWPDFRIFRQTNYTITVVAVFLMEWGLFVPITYISAWALKTGAGSATFAYQLLAILNAGSVLGRWLPGYVADKWGRFNTMILAMFLCFVVLVGLWLPASLHGSARGSVALGIVFSFGFGFASGSGISLTPVCIGQLCDVEEYGRYYSTCYTIVSFGCLTGLPIVGELLRRCDGEFWGLITFTSAAYLAGMVGFIIVRVRVVGWKWSAIY